MTDESDLPELNFTNDAMNDVPEKVAADESDLPELNFTNDAMKMDNDKPSDAFLPSDEEMELQLSPPTDLPLTPEIPIVAEESELPPKPKPKRTRKGFTKASLKRRKLMEEAA